MDFFSSIESILLKLDSSIVFVRMYFQEIPLVFDALRKKIKIGQKWANTNFILRIDK